MMQEKDELKIEDNLEISTPSIDDIKNLNSLGCGSLRITTPYMPSHLRVSTTPNPFNSIHGEKKFQTPQITFESNGFNNHNNHNNHNLHNFLAIQTPKPAPVQTPFSQIQIPNSTLSFLPIQTPKPSFQPPAFQHLPQLNAHPQTSAHPQLNAQFQFQQYQQQLQYQQELVQRQLNLQYANQQHENQHQPGQHHVPVRDYQLIQNQNELATQQQQQLLLGQGKEQIKEDGQKQLELEVVKLLASNKENRQNHQQKKQKREKEKDSKKEKNIKKEKEKKDKKEGRKRDKKLKEKKIVNLTKEALELENEEKTWDSELLKSESEQKGIFSRKYPVQLNLYKLENELNQSMFSHGLNNNNLNKNNQNNQKMTDSVNLSLPPLPFDFDSESLDLNDDDKNAKNDKSEKENEKEKEKKMGPHEESRRKHKENFMLDVDKYLTEQRKCLQTFADLIIDYPMALSSDEKYLKVVKQHVPQNSKFLDYDDLKKLRRENNFYIHHAFFNSFTNSTYLEVVAITQRLVDHVLRTTKERRAVHFHNHKFRQKDLKKKINNLISSSSPASSSSSLSLEKQDLVSKTENKNESENKNKNVNVNVNEKNQDNENDENEKDEDLDSYQRNFQASKVPLTLWQSKHGKWMNFCLLSNKTDKKILHAANFEDKKRHTPVNHVVCSKQKRKIAQILNNKKNILTTSPYSSPSFSPSSLVSPHTPPTPSLSLSPSSLSSLKTQSQSKETHSTPNPLTPSTPNPISIPIQMPMTMETQIQKHDSNGQPNDQSLKSNMVETQKTDLLKLESNSSSSTSILSPKTEKGIRNQKKFKYEEKSKNEKSKNEKKRDKRERNNPPVPLFPLFPPLPSISTLTMNTMNTLYSNQTSNQSQNSVPVINHSEIAMQNNPQNNSQISVLPPMYRDLATRLLN